MEQGVIDVSPAANLPQVSAHAPRPRPCPESIVDSAKVQAGVRETLMVRLGSELGLRRKKIATVHEDHMLRDLLGWSLVVLGKGGRRRVHPASRALSAETHDVDGREFLCLEEPPG